MSAPGVVERNPPISRGMGLLIIATLLNGLGYQVFVPVLPLYLGKLGASPELIGLIAGIGLVAYGLGQFPAGLLADRFDRRVVAVFSTIAYGSFFIVYTLPLPLDIAIVFRLAHAFVGGFFTPVSLAMAADLAPKGRVSRGYGLWQATTMGGFLVGPLLGGIVSDVSIDAVFVLAAALCFATSIPVLLIPRLDLAAAQAARVAATLVIDVARSRVLRLLPIMLVAAGPEYLSGAVTGIWPIYLASLGGQGWEIGLSFTLYALPAVLLSVPYGDLVDRVGGRAVMTAALVGTAALMPLFMGITAVPILLGLLAAAGVAVAAERPVVYSEVTRVADPSEFARAQGVLQVGLMISQSTGAIATGILFGFSAPLAFAVVAVVCLLSLFAVPRLRPPLRAASSAA